MVSAGMSIIPEMMEKIELDGTTKYFKTTKTDIVNRMTGSRIMFRGIKTSSGNQTAKLKSIQGITTFVCDEAEEWTSEEEFDKIMLSIRKKGIQNRIIIIMNPCDSNHFIYKNTSRIPTAWSRLMACRYRFLHIPMSFTFIQPTSIISRTFLLSF